MNSESESFAVRKIISGQQDLSFTDQLAVEQPLEIRIEGRPVAVVMRSPGHDLELTSGFLYTEAVIDGLDDIRAIAHVDDPLDPQGNTVDVVLASGVPAARRHKADRTLFASSSCGICGKAAIERVFLHAPPVEPSPEPSPELILGLPEKLLQAQKLFAQTGGIHAAALFDMHGKLEVLREDIGRHNAVDKVIGWKLRQDEVPVTNSILLISGRAGFEIIQKAIIARIPVVAAVGAPSAMAAQAAFQANIHLIGFLRDSRYNIYQEPSSCS